MLAVEDSVSWHDTIRYQQKKVILSGKRCPARGVMVMCYGCYDNGFQFDSYLADFCFFSLLFFRLS